MYSIVLFMVDRSFNGFLGSGEMPTSAVDKMARHVRVRDTPGERDEVREAEAFAQRHEVVEAIARSDEGKADVATAQAMHHVIRQLHDEVDAILRPHHPQVGGHVGRGAPEARVRLRWDGAGSDRVRCGRRSHPPGRLRPARGAISR